MTNIWPVADILPWGFSFALAMILYMKTFVEGEGSNKATEDKTA